MGYSAEAYKRAKEVLEKRRAAAESESDRRRAELHEKSPEAAEIDRALRRTGMAIFRAACEGGRDGEAFRRVMEDNQSLLEARRALLASLGLPPDYTEVHYTCAACGDSGYVDIRMCDCLRRELILASFQASGLGALLEKQTFDTFSLDYYRDDAQNLRRMESNLTLARRYAETFSRDSGNLLFVGRTGLGKTHLSTAIARAAIERGFDVCYESAQNVFADFEAERFRSRREGEEPRTERYFSTDLLILDDIGTEAVTAFTVSCFYNIVNSRLIAGLPTIISTNLGADELAARYDDRLTSRLFGEYQTLVFVGRDVRMQKLG